MKAVEVLNYLENSVDPDAPVDDMLKSIISALVAPVKGIHFVKTFRDYPTTAWEDSYIAELENGLYAVVWYGECGEWFNIFKSYIFAKIYAETKYPSSRSSYYKKAIEQIEKILNANLTPQDSKLDFSIIYKNLPKQEQDFIKKQIISQLIGTEVKVNIEGNIKKGYIENIEDNDIIFNDEEIQINSATINIEGKSAFVWYSSDNIQATKDITVSTSDGVKIKLTVAIPEFEGVIL